MRTKGQVIERLGSYHGPQTMYLDYGYIIWQTTTGENFEILFIEVKETGQGLGVRLMKEWLTKLIKAKTLPFTSVSVTRLASNVNAGKFYRKLGFQEYEINGLYKVPAVFSVMSFHDLCSKLGVS